MATIKIKKTFDKTLENGGNVTKAMREVGYKEATIHNPSNVTGTKAWAELMKEYLPDELLAKKHKELLEKTDLLGNMDVTAVRAALDMGYKLKGTYAAEKKDHTTGGKPFPILGSISTE